MAILNLKICCSLIIIEVHKDLIAPLGIQSNSLTEENNNY